MMAEGPDHIDFDFDYPDFAKAVVEVAERLPAPKPGDGDGRKLLMEDAAVADGDPAPAPISDFQRFPITDAGNAELLAARHGEDLRYDHARGRWLYFLGHGWNEDRDGVVVRLALAAARARFMASANFSSGREAAARWAIRSESRDRIAAALSIAESLLPCADKGDGWDDAPFLLGTPGGVVELRTGEIRPGRREDRITMSTGTVFDPAARAPRWDTFLDEVFRGDRDLVDFVHRAVGYAATGATTEEIFLLLCGSGANGKTKFLSAIRGALGDYAAETSFLTFEKTQRRSGEATPDLAELPGKRFVTASEGTDGVQWDARRVKVLTGGDPVKARALYQNSITFRPAAVFFLSSNFRPRVDDESEAFWRRIVLVPFTRYFPPAERDPDLERKLAAEREGILAWIVRGAVEYQCRGLAPPEAVTAATSQYREDEDPLADFIAECCSIGPTTRASAGDLYAAHTRWAERNGETPLKQRTFGVRLAGRGFDQFKGVGGKRFWLGIGVKGGVSAQGGA